MHQNEIDHMTVDNTVIQVTQCAAQNQGKGNGQPGVIAPQTLEPDHQHGTDHDRDQGKQPALPAGTVRQEAEGRTGVVSQGPAEQVGNHHNLLVHLQRIVEVDLAGQVNDQDQHSQPEPAQAPEAPGSAGIRHSDVPHQRR